MASLPSTSPPVTLESLHAALEGAVSLLKEAQSERQREEAERRQRLEDAKARLADYMQAPRLEEKNGLQAQPNLFKLFLAIDLAEDQPVKLWSTIKYIGAILWMTLAGIFARLDMEKIIKTLTHNSPSTGYRLRLKKGLDKYALAVRASVGAQTVCREARQDFCAHALSQGVGEIDLDAAVKELALPYPSHLQRPDDKQVGVPDLRFGNDIAEARAAIEQLIVSTVVSRYIARMDELVAYIGTLLVAFLAFVATIVILAFPPSLLLSQLGAGANTADPPCSLRLVGPGFPAGTCIKPIDPIEDGTSLYKVHVYVAICAIAAPILWVCAAGIAMQVMLGMTLEVLKGVDHSRARVMFEQHPLSPAAVAQSSDRTKEEGKDLSQRLIEEGRRQLDRGEFGARAGKPTPHSGEPDVTAAAAAPPPPPSSLSERFNAFIALLMPAFKAEIESSRDGVLCMETEDFLETYDMMREDVADASLQVGINVSSMMTLITQGLAGLAVFLVVVSSMTFVSGQRFVVHILCGLTRDTRVYAFLVLAESTRYLNTVLWIDQCLEKKEGKSLDGGDLKSSTLVWPWANEMERRAALARGRGQAQQGGGVGGGALVPVLAPSPAPLTLPLHPSLLRVGPVARVNEEIYRVEISAEEVEALEREEKDKARARAGGAARQPAPPPANCSVQ